MAKPPNQTGQVKIVRQGFTASDFGSDPQIKGTYAENKPKDLKVK